MKLETFFEKFEQFADAPNAVVRMRRFILDLAVRGKLVSQDTTEEPANDLLKRVQTEKERLVKSGEIKKQEQLPPISEDALPFSLPAGWTLSQLGDIAVCLDYMREPINGTERDLRIAGKTQSKLFPYYGATQQQGWIDDFIFDAELVLLGEDGVPFFDELRPKAYLISGKTWVNNHAHVFRGILVSNVFLMHWLNTFDYTGRVAGSTRAKLNQAKAVDIPIALPPLAEQKRIVAKVDELMALCDRLEALQQERDTRHAALARASLARFAEAPTPVNLDFLFHPSYTVTPTDLRKSILTLAVQGKLVPQDPNDEPIDELLAQCLAERQKYKQAAATSVQIIAGEDALGYDIPVSWRWQALDDLLIFGPTNGFSPKAVEYETPVCSLTLSATTSGKFKGEHSKFITTDVPSDSELWLRDGDILVQRGNSFEYVGVAAVYRGEPNRFVYPDLMMKFRVSSALDVGFIHLAMSQDAARDYLRARASGTSGSMPKINQTALKSLPVPIPPLAEQRRIVAKVDQLMALVDQLESQLSEAKSKSAALLEAIVHELLNPAAEVIDLASYRAAIGCYAISKMSDKPYFGRTTAMKTLYLAEAHVGMKLGFQPEREAAGPLDHWIYRFEEEGKQKEWFKAVVENTSNGKIEYQPGKMLAAQAAQAESLLTPDQRKEFDRLLDLLSDRKTEEVEIIATLFAVWNDFLIDGHAPNDDEIVTEVRENWHESKERFTPALLRKWLGWLRKNNLVPQGRLPHTVHQSKLSLN